MKIGPVDVEISDLTEIAKTYFKIYKQQQNINPSRLRLAQSGGQVMRYIIIKGHLYSASSQGPQMRYVGRDGSIVT